jgi:hypothetical protein
VVVAAGVEWAAEEVVAEEEEGAKGPEKVMNH